MDSLSGWKMFELVDEVSSSELTTLSFLSFSRLSLILCSSVTSLFHPPFVSISPTHTHSGPSLFCGGGPGGKGRRGLQDRGYVALHGPALDWPLPSGPVSRLRPLLPVCHVGAVCHLRTPGGSCLNPSTNRSLTTVCPRINTFTLCSPQ